MRLWMILIGILLLGLPALAQDAQVIATLPHTGGDVVFGAAWSPDSTRFVRYIRAFFPDPSPTGILVDAATGTIIHEFAVLSDAVWTPDGTHIIAVGDYPGVMRLNATTFEETLLIEGFFENLKGVNHAVNKFAQYDHKNSQTHIYNLLTGESLYTVPGAFLQWSADDSRLVIQTNQDDTPYFTVYAADTGAAMAVFTTTGAFNTLSPDGTVWLGHSELEYEIRPIDDENTVMTFTTQLTNERGCGVVDYFAAFSPDSTRVLLPYLNGTARIWEVLTGQPLVTLALPDKEIRQAYWSSDGTRILAVTTLNDSITVFDASSGTQLVEIIPDEVTIDPAGAVWNADNTVIMIPSWSGTTQLYAAATGEHLLDAKHHSLLYACGVFFIPPLLSPDGRYLVTWEDGATRSKAPIIGGTGRVERTENFVVYAAPSAESTVMATYQHVDELIVKLLANENGFWHVELPDGTRGWVDTYLSGLRELRDPVLQIWRVPQP